MPPTATSTALWRIGDWDGTPTEFLNGDQVTTMHPSDVRMRPWKTADYVVGSSAAANDFPAYQWKDVNGSITVRFKLRADQIAAASRRLAQSTAWPVWKMPDPVGHPITSRPCPARPPATS